MLWSLSNVKGCSNNRYTVTYMNNSFNGRRGIVRQLKAHSSSMVRALGCRLQCLDPAAFTERKSVYPFFLHDFNVTFIILINSFPLTCDALYFPSQLDFISDLETSIWRLMSGKRNCCGVCWMYLKALWASQVLISSIILKRRQVALQLKARKQSSHHENHQIAQIIENPVHM